jgi:small-conductance mechanosensitive channel
LGKGDKLGNGKSDGIDIGTLRATMMKIGQWVNADGYNRRIVTIANSLVFKELVFNYSGEFANEAKVG